jgi:hypothetical protein
MAPVEPKRPRPKLTPQQMRALFAFEGSAEGDTASEGQCWAAGVRPWPTMWNLVAKGVAVDAGEAHDEEDGYLYALTAAGGVERDLLIEERWPS